MKDGLSLMESTFRLALSLLLTQLTGLIHSVEPTLAPPVPGEDFFNNALSGVTFPLDVRGKAVVISVEPVPDNSTAPFALKPLVGVSGQETAPTTHDLDQNLNSLPTGNISF
jgi:hypothetical protein